MNIDHVFLSGKGQSVSVIRTDSVAQVVCEYETTLDTSTSERVSDVLFSRFSNDCILITNSEEDGSFLRKRRVCDILEIFKGQKVSISTLAWPLVLYDILPNATLDAIAKYYGLDTKGEFDTAQFRCRLLAETYWQLMKRYKGGAILDNTVRELGGDNLKSLLRIIGF